MTVFHNLVEGECHSTKRCQACDESFPGMIYQYSSDEICAICKRDKKSPPLFSLGNKCNPGEQPPELRALTVVEQMLIAMALSSFRVYRIAGQGQLGFKGHVINFFQAPQGIARSLPRTNLPILLIERTIGNSRKVLRVRRWRVARALIWLQKNNPFYRSININEEAMSALPDDGD